MSSTLKLKRKQNEGDDTITQQKKQRFDVQASPQPTLQQSLDLSTLDTPSIINERFDHLARALLQDFHLVVRSVDEETAFEILELEFYLWKDGCHEDPFTHGSEGQKVSGRWYFHRAPRRSNDSTRNLTNPSAYRGGSRKGMDLTIGGPNPTASSPYFGQAQAAVATTSAEHVSTRGGALLRSLRRVSDNKVISGPSLLVDEILRINKAANIPELVQQKWANDISAFGSRPNSLFLRPRQSSSELKPMVYCSPRIGLDLSHPGTTASLSHPRVVFLSRPYRYFIRPDLLTAKGRPQTFLGVLQASLDTTCAGHELQNPLLLQELVRITRLGEKAVSRYLEYYRGGVESGKIEDFIGAQGKGAGSSPATYLKMMGTLAQTSLD